MQHILSYLSWAILLLSWAFHPELLKELKPAMVLNQVKEELFYLLLTLVTHKKRVTGVPDFCFDQVHKWNRLATDSFTRNLLRCYIVYASPLCFCLTLSIICISLTPLRWSLVWKAKKGKISDTPRLRIKISIWHTQTQASPPTSKSEVGGKPFLSFTVRWALSQLSSGNPSLSNHCLCFQMLPPLSFKSLPQLLLSNHKSLPLLSNCCLHFIIVVSTFNWQFFTSAHHNSPSFMTLIQSHGPQKNVRLVRHESCYLQCTGLTATASHWSNDQDCWFASNDTVASITAAVSCVDWIVFRSIYHSNITNVLQRSTQVTLTRTQVSFVNWIIFRSPAIPPKKKKVKNSLMILNWYNTCIRNEQVE